MIDPTGGIAVVTALFGGFDTLHPPVAQDLPVEWICVTDDPGLSVPGWRTVVHTGAYDHPRMSAKVPKMLPAQVLSGQRYSLFIDANVCITSPAFVRGSLAALGEGPFSAWVHPERQCIYREAVECLRLPKCIGQPIVRQIAHYADQGHPTGWGLYGCRSLAWDNTHPLAEEIGTRWLEECERWSYRDQLSLPVVMRDLQIRPGTFPHHLHAHDGPAGMICRIKRKMSAPRRIAYRLGIGGSAPRTALADIQQVLQDHRPPQYNQRLERDPTSPNPWYQIAEHQSER